MNTFLHNQDIKNKVLACQEDLEKLLVDKEFSFLRDIKKRVIQPQKGVVLDKDYVPEKSVVMSAYHFLSEYFRQMKSNTPILLANIKEYDNILELHLKEKKRKLPKSNIYMLAEDYEEALLPDSSIYNIMPI